MSGYYWLASYPKSGNTWLRLGLESLSRGGEPPNFASKSVPFAPLASDRVAFDEILDVDSNDLDDNEAELLRPQLYQIETAMGTKPKILKVHDAWIETRLNEPLFPLNVTLGVVYIVRDPRDVAVSLAHHLAIDVDRAIDFMGYKGAILSESNDSASPQLRQRLLTWSEHVTSWLRIPKPLLILRYEDMLVNPVAALEKCAEHVGFRFDYEAVIMATNSTRFDLLKAAEERDGFKEKAHPETRFFRRGVAGGWRDTLTSKHINRLLTDHGDVMAQFGYL